MTERPDRHLKEMEEESESVPNGSVSGDQNKDLTKELDEMVNGVPPLEICEVGEQCIYRVPPRIREAHPKAYTPQVISIGPFHNPRDRGDTNRDPNILCAMENLKLKYLKEFLRRTEVSVVDLALKFKKLENRIRSCYAGGHVIYNNNNDFLKIIITDACFIIEYFLRYFNHEWNEKDPDVWLFSHIGPDLILLENQLPFFVLEEIYQIAGIYCKIHYSFLHITIHYFHYFIKQYQKKEVFINTERYPKHFTDLLRLCFIPPSSSFNIEQKEQEAPEIEHVYSLSQLKEVGIKFEVKKDNDCLLDLKFDKKKGVLKMPCLMVHDQTEMYLMNILAFEECHCRQYSDYVAQYLSLLDFFINTEKDVSILVDKDIIINWMGDIKSVATMINKLCYNVSMPSIDPGSLYYSLCRDLIDFYKNDRNKHKATLKRQYFNTPWRGASTIAAVLLLFLTLIQTICSIWSLAKEKKIV